MIVLRLEYEQDIVDGFAETLGNYTYGPGINSPEIAEQVYALMIGLA